MENYNAIFLSHSPPTSRFIEAYGIEDFNKYGLSLKYVCVRGLLERNFKLDEECDIDYIYAKNYNNLKKIINNATTLQVIIIDIGLNNNSFWLYRLLYNISCKVFFLDYVTARPLPLKRPFFRYSLIKPRLNYFLNNLFLELKKIFLKYRVIDHYFVRTQDKLSASNTSVLPSSDVFTAVKYINSVDSFIERSDDLRINSYIVFLDVYLPFHKDNILMNLPYLNSEKYQLEIIKFFDLLEKYFGLDVVVAAHPSANYRENYFGKRRIIYDETCGLIWGSKFCISHHSTSVSFAILFNKQVLFFHTNEMENLYRDSLLANQIAVANSISARSLNISKSFSLSEKYYYSDINEYKSYIEQYLCTHVDWNNIRTDSVAYAISSKIL